MTCDNTSTSSVVSKVSSSAHWYSVLVGLVCWANQMARWPGLSVNVGDSGDIMISYPYDYW